MNIVRIILALLFSFLAFGLPLWNLFRLQSKKHIFYFLIGPVIVLGSFFISNYLEAQELTSLYIPMKNFAYYSMIVGLMLFGVSILVTLAQYAFKISKKVAFVLIILGTLIYAGTARINGQRVVVKDLNLPAENISRNYNFVHITDLHSGSTNRAHAQKVVDKIKSLNPEFMVITGDFIDEYHVDSSYIEPFNQINFPMYLITGNHEYYLREGKILEVLEGSKIQLIDHQKIPFEDLDIIGVNELATVSGTLNHVGGIDPDRYSILLDHQPKEDEAHIASQSGIHLMLSGHTHNGQVWPMNWLVKLQFVYISGLYEIGEMFLYVNQGTGTLGPKMRVNSVNEITNITLSPKTSR